MIHNIKILRSFADAVLSGDKNFEVRENDRGYQKGDTVNFTVVDRNGICMSLHKLNAEFFEITYVLSGWGIKDGYVVFGIKRIEEEGGADNEV